MDQRARERLPVLPVLLTQVNDGRITTAAVGGNDEPDEGVASYGVDSEVGITRVRGGRQSAGGDAEVHGLSPDESDGVTLRL